MSKPSFISTPPKLIQCHRCAAWILTGTAEGLRARVDPVKLSATEQLLAHLGGLELYRLDRFGLWRVDQDRIRSAHLWVIVPQHRCGVRWSPKETRLSERATEVDTPPY
jgi:hypothetical protein